MPAWDIRRFQEVFVRSRALADADFPWEKCMVIQYNADVKKEGLAFIQNGWRFQLPFLLYIIFSAIMQEGSNETEPVVRGEYNGI